MEENVKNNYAQTGKEPVKCVKCQKQVGAESGVETANGFVCNECAKKAKMRKRGIIGGVSAGVLAIAAAVGLNMPNNSATGFDGVGEINDSMNIVVDTASVSLDLSAATAISSSVSTQAPIASIKDFQHVMEKNIAGAQKKSGSSVEIPPVAVFFDINTNNYVNNDNTVLLEFAKYYLQTNKKASILIEGYTCDLGSDNLNDNLSRARAEVVKGNLEKAGVPSDKIEIKWYGKSRYGDFKYSDKSEYRRVIVSIK